jgi:hypothetical protein
VKRIFFVQLMVVLAWSAAAGTAFEQGLEAYRATDFEAAAKAFRQAAREGAAAGTLLDLGLAEWQLHRAGPAILAWEQVLWLDPFNEAARTNLRFARKVAQIEAPELSWNEVVSTWLPVNWWAWIAGISLWMAVGAATLPGVLRQPKAAWHQAVAAFGIMLFLLSVPAHIGVHTRTHLGFVRQKDTILRLTPTAEAQGITQLAPGEPVRWMRTRGPYCLVKTTRATGWITRDQLGLICPPDGRVQTTD